MEHAAVPDPGTGTGRLVEAGKLPPWEEVDQLVGRFIADLERQEVSPKTRASYRLDLLYFASWFRRTVGERFSPEAVTPTDVREYRSYLLNVEKR